MRRDTPPDWRHGLQLAAAVVIAYLASAALHLPESLWAVMSALIVMRPTAGSTMGAGWERMRGTAAGTLFGLIGVWLHHLGVASSLSTLGIVALLALASAPFPAMRSAPITALIVLSSGGIAGHPALKVAGLRVIEIAIGVATGLAVSLIGRESHAHARFDAACAALLRRLAGEVRRGLGTEAQTPAQRDAAATTSRLALRELAILAVSADREAKLWHRRSRPESTEACARTARLMTRISSDAALFARLREGSPQDRHDPAWSALADAVAVALEASAGALAERSTPDLGPLRALGRARPGTGAEGTAPLSWTAPTARLLLQDLAALQRGDGGAVRRPQPPPLPPEPTS